MKSIGDRIRYFRRTRNMTQDKLAELSGIHPVSIRKYETNKMQPQIEQVERIASVLDVNTFAIVGYNARPTVMRTFGDMTGVLMTLFKAHVLMIVGDQHFSDEDTHKEGFNVLKGFNHEKTLIMFNPTLRDYFNVAKVTNLYDGKFKTGKLALTDLGLMFKDKDYAEKFLRWALFYTYCEHISIELKERNEENPIMDALMDELEEMELDLLSSTTPLRRPGFEDYSEAMFFYFGKYDK